MTAKEYLQQARFLDQRIDSKIAQVASLNDLATKCSATLTGMPRNPNRGGSTMADAVCKIVDLQAEINRDIDRLVDLKREIMDVIKAVPNTEYQTILEKRYLCLTAWEQIAVDLCYSIQHTYRMHDAALKEVERIIYLYCCLFIQSCCKAGIFIDPAAKNRGAFQLSCFRLTVHFTYLAVRSFYVL